MNLISAWTMCNKMPSQWRGGSFVNAIHRNQEPLAAKLFADVFYRLYIHKDKFSIKWLNVKPRLGEEEDEELGKADPDIITVLRLQRAIEKVKTR